MMYRRLFIGVFFFVSTLLQAETIRLTNGEWPPYLSEHYKHQGVVSRIVREAFEISEIDVEYGFFPWARAFKNAKLGNEWLGSVVWAITPERRDDFVFSDAVFGDKTVFFHLAINDVRWTSLKDLSQYQIGATRSYAYGEEFHRLEKEGVLNVKWATHDVNNFRKLLAGRIDLFPVQEFVGIEILKTNFSESEFNKIRYTQSFRETPYYLMLNKNAPESERYIRLFNQGLSALKASGKLQKYLSDNAKGLYRPPLIEE